jgi:hypothetical protein
MQRINILGKGACRSGGACCKGCSKHDDQGVYISWHGVFHGYVFFCIDVEGFASVPESKKATPEDDLSA